MFRARAFRVKRTLCNFLYSVGNVALPVAGKIDALAALHCQRRYAAHLIAIRDAVPEFRLFDPKETSRMSRPQIA
jgi:hypothetical protein